jgi:SAM-dependent methyltransferase
MDKFDVIILLFIPISTYDYNRALENFKKYLKPGGIFITNCFGYRENIDRDRLVLRSDIEFLENPETRQPVVRLNYYEFKKDIVNWDAIYLVPEENGYIKMKRDHDILSVCPEEEIKDPIYVNKGEFEILPNYQITECNDSMTPPALYEYLVGRRYRGGE